jgi:large subunit ribosomal protein L9
MKVILADDVRGLGHRGDTVSVKPGYARNFLFPQGAAYEATTANLRRLSEEKRRYDDRMLSEKGVAEEVAKKVEGLTVAVTKKAGEEGHLYGSVTASEIRRLGSHTVHVRLHRDVVATLTVDVQALGAAAS